MGERRRTREPEPEQDTRYSQAVAHFEAVRERVNNPYVMRNEDLSFETNAQGRVKIYSHFTMDDAPLPDLQVFRRDLRDTSGRHTHQGGLAILGIEGEGETLIDGERVQWEPGDLVLLPVKPNGLEHQHFNRNDPDEPAEWLAVYFLPYLEHAGAMFKQNESAPEWNQDEDHDHSHDGMYDNEEFADFSYGDWLDYEPPEQTDTLYDDFIVRRNKYRKQMAVAQEANKWTVMRKEQTEWEINPQGKMRWYLHPGMDDTSVTSFIWATQEIPPGSRTGKQHRQGGIIHYILTGEGYSIINGDRYDWGEKDLVSLPIKPDGHTVQHFNDNPSEPVRFVRAEPFLHNELGYDLGCGFKQLEPCPEYREQ